MEGKTKPFRKIGTAMMLMKFKEQNNRLFENKDFISKLSNVLAEDMQAVEKYVHDYGEYSSEGVRDSIMEFVEKNKLWDEAIMSHYRRMVKLLPHFEFIQHLKRAGNYTTTISKDALPFATEYLKMKKVRLNLDLYQTASLFDNTEKEEEDEE